MDQDPDVIRQIAHVYVDLLSLGEASLSDPELAAALDLAGRRAVDLGALVIHQDGETLTVDPTNLVAGGMRAMRALIRIIEQDTALSHDSLLTEWRETIDGRREQGPDA
jgi:hypothetical protein